MKKIKNALYSLLLMLIIFYVIYPVALPIFGFSFIFTSGLLGIMLYVYHKYPFSEVVSLILFFMLLVGWAVLCLFLNSERGDTFIFDYTKSQIAWLFSAYLVIYLFFKRHPNGGVHLLIYYIIAAITLQGIISVAMYQDPAIADFFDKLQMSTELSIGKRSMTEGKRLLGYGIAFFGAGIVYGLSMILIVYIFMSRKLSFLKQFFWAALYVATFIIGLLSARTTVVGAGASAALLVILLIKGDKTYRSQTFSMIFYTAIAISIGVWLTYNYFADFADWAFEPFLNYKQDGEFRTSSSDGLAVMFSYPETVFEWIFGWGKGGFWGSDVGYTRLFFWFGIPGTILFFSYGYLLVKPCFSADKALNITLLVILAYNLALNVKGLSDLNQFCVFFTFYFLYYKYYIYTPYLYRIGKIKQNTLRNAVQGSSSGGRL